jgi:hypothetical protein
MFTYTPTSFQLKPELNNPCENPRRKEHIANFVKKFPTAKGRVPDTILIVDPRSYYVSENPKDNTVPVVRFVL